MSTSDCLDSFNSFSLCLNNSRKIKLGAKNSKSCRKSVWRKCEPFESMAENKILVSTTIFMVFVVINAFYFVATIPA